MVCEGECSKAGRGWGGIFLTAHPGHSSAMRGEERPSSDPEHGAEWGGEERCAGPGAQPPAVQAGLRCTATSLRSRSVGSALGSRWVPASVVVGRRSRGRAKALLPGQLQIKINSDDGNNGYPFLFLLCHF